MSNLKKIIAGVPQPQVTNGEIVTAQFFNPVVDAVNDLIDGTIDTDNVVVTNDVTVGNEVIITNDGVVAEPALKVGTTENGLYEVSSTQLGVSVGDALVAMFNPSGLVTGAIEEQVTSVGVNIKADGGLIISDTAGTGAAPISSPSGAAMQIKPAAPAPTSNGGDLYLLSGDGGATSGDSGLLQIQTGDVDTGDSGLVSVASAPVATLGKSGDVTLKSGDSDTSGDTGLVTIKTGNAISGLAGNVRIQTGTSTSATVIPHISLEKGVVKKPTATSIALTGGVTITVAQLINGGLLFTGTTGDTATLPTGAEISTALGGDSAGKSFDFIVNAGSINAAEVATIAVGASGIVVAKQVSSGDSATDQLMTVTKTSALEVGIFRLVNIGTDSWSLHRIA